MWSFLSIMQNLCEWRETNLMMCFSPSVGPFDFGCTALQVSPKLLKVKYDQLVYTDQKPLVQDVVIAVY